ncbi:hypothetical protein D3C78_1516830 [compost metagenome]
MQRPLELGVLVAASGLFIFLLLLTLLLREHTASRLDPRRQISSKVLGTFIGFAGGGIVWLAWLIASGQYHSGTRRGLMLMKTIELIGPWLPAAVFFALGLQLMWFGYCAWRER